MNTISTLGELKNSDYRARSVKQEMRENLIRMMRDGETLFPEIIGYEDTVIPQIQNAILSRHDILLLGLRGQAKTRMIRAFVSILDEWIPTLADSELPDEPLNPVFQQNKTLIEKQGNDTRITWIHRSDRYHEKLATPDVTIADLIGEIDLVKHAGGKHLSDEGVLHFGLIPRSNRGIFAINELPDLSPRIQVGLFNVLQERDVQIRGFPVRLPLDISISFTANPEDYTNRGRIITPLKDRIGSVIRTHYPDDLGHAVNITRQNAWLERKDNSQDIIIPPYMHEIVEEICRIARSSTHINQQSGVSVRASISSMENVISNAERRAIMHNENRIVPRITDLHHLEAGYRGKIELMLAEDDVAEDKFIKALTGEAVKKVFDKYSSVEEHRDVIDMFANNGHSIEIGDEVSTKELASQIDNSSSLKKAAVSFCVKVDRNFEEHEELCAAAEFLLEALYVSDRLSKYSYSGKNIFKR